MAKIMKPFVFLRWWKELADKMKIISPCAGGIIKNYMKNLIPDDSWYDGLNVRFGEGYISKVEGWTPFNNIQISGRVVNIDNLYTKNGGAWLIIHSLHRVYYYDEGEREMVDITQIPFVTTTSESIMSENIADLYLMTNLVDNVYCWDGINPTVEKMPGIWNPPTWIPNKHYIVGDYVKPTNANSNGYMYRCTTEGISHVTTEPPWPSPTGGINDGTCRWELYGGLGLEGTEATDCRCKCMLNYNGFLILGHTIEDGVNYPQRIRWSQWENPFVWHNNEDLSGQAGYADLSEGVDWVQRLVPLGPQIVCYKERSIQVLTYVGGDIIFEKRPAIIGTGLLAPKAIVDLGDEHIFIGPDNIYSFDLIEPKICGDDIAKDFFRLLLPNKTNEIHGFFVEEIPEIIFTFHSINNQEVTDGIAEPAPDMALVYNTDTKKWSIREMPMTAFGYYTKSDDTVIDDLDMEIDTMDWPIDTSTKFQNSPINICGDKDGHVYILEGQSHDGEGYEAWAITKLHDMSRPDILKRLKRVQVMTSREGPYDLLFWIGSAGNIEDSLTWHGPFKMNLSKLYPPWVDMDVTSRYFAIKFGTLNKNEPFKVTGYIMYYEERGEI